MRLAPLMGMDMNVMVGLQFLHGITCYGRRGRRRQLGKYILHMIFIYLIFWIKFDLQILHLLPSKGDLGIKMQLKLKIYHIVN